MPWLDSLWFSSPAFFHHLLHQCIPEDADPRTIGCKDDYSLKRKRKPCHYGCYGFYLFTLNPLIGLSGKKNSILGFIAAWMSPIANPIGIKLQSFGSKKIHSNLSKAYPEDSLLTSQSLYDVIKPPRK